MPETTRRKPKPWKKGKKNAGERYRISEGGRKTLRKTEPTRPEKRPKKSLKGWTVTIYDQKSDRVLEKRSFSTRAAAEAFWEEYRVRVLERSPELRSVLGVRYKKGGFQLE